MDSDALAELMALVCRVAEGRPHEPFHRHRVKFLGYKDLEHRGVPIVFSCAHVPTFGIGGAELFGEFDVPCLTEQMSQP